MPAAYRGRIKRPDFLVSLPDVGMVAFDVKAKSLAKSNLLFSKSEIHRLRHFARLFRLHVVFACFDPDVPPNGYWVRLSQLDKFTPVGRRYGSVYEVSIRRVEPFSLNEPFQEAFARLTLQLPAGEGRT